MNNKSSSHWALALLLLLAVFFAGAYGQWPLFSSNQNTYFLHGLAFVEEGPLRQDWLANTTDHIPVFSAYVFFVIKWLSLDVFYFTHAALIAAYALCFIWFVKRLPNQPQSDPVLALSLVLFTLMHSDIVAKVLNVSRSPLLGTFSSFFKYTTQGVAGQSLLGHYLQPSVFGVFLLVSLCSFLSGKQRIAIIIAGLVPWFHAAYFLPAGLLTIGYILIDYKERRFSKALQTGLLAFLVVLPPLFYTLVNFSATSAEIASLANNILIYERFPHHADPQSWFGVSVLFQLLWVIGGIIIVRKDKKLLIILLTLFLGAFSLTLVQVFTASEVLAILQPWRLSALLVPISSAIIIGSFIHTIRSRTTFNVTHRKAVLFVCSVLMAALFLIGVSFTLFSIDRTKVKSSLVEYASSKCAPGDIYLIPLDWEWFRLATKCPIYVDWKSHPFRDIEIIEWYKRVQLARTFYGTDNDINAVETLEQILEHSQITHVVVERDTRLLYEYMYAHIVFDDGMYFVFELENNGVVK